MRGILDGPRQRIQHLLCTTNAPTGCGPRQRGRLLCALWWTPRAAEDGLPDVAFGNVMIAWRTLVRVRKVQGAVQVTSDVKCVCRQVCAVFHCIGHMRVAMGFVCVTACKCLDMCWVADNVALGPRWVQCVEAGLPLDAASGSLCWPLGG